ncbi:MAG: U3 snoRNP-associated protein Imp3 [Amphiamblys sp. WSBS2006]|nr:MAG: U3 snoRNP-associated protein Imp3 [Amphiamblys sp. WSBS2006]
MVRKLKHHETKLLKKADLFSWKTDNKKEYAVINKYGLQKREEYTQYSYLAGKIEKVTRLVSLLTGDDPFKAEMTRNITNKLYNAGLIDSRNSLEACAKVPVSVLCQRRLSAMLVALKMSETISHANTVIEHGHVCVGVSVVRDPSFHVQRGLEDSITWTNGSKIKKHIQKYENNVDDYETH